MKRSRFTLSGPLLAGQRLRACNTPDMVRALNEVDLPTRVIPDQRVEQTLRCSIQQSALFRIRS